MVVPAKTLVGKWWFERGNWPGVWPRKDFQRYFLSPTKCSRSLASSKLENNDFEKRILSLNDGSYRHFTIKYDLKFK